MSTQVQRRRGSTSDHSTFTGAVGEITIDTDKDVVVVHDGTTAGGFPHVRAGGALGTPASGTLTNCSGLPASGLVTSTSQAVGFGSIELGHASDTTLSRASAGVLAVEGNSVAMLATTQTFTAPQRGTQTTDNDLSMDLSVTNFWSCTPSAGGALTFTNIPTGQGGIIKFVNGSNYAITAAATTKVTSTFLATISATGTYIIHYYGDGTNVYCSTAGAMA